MVPSDEYLEWLFATAEWQIDALGMTRTVPEGAKIVLPTAEDFPVDASLEGEALAHDYFGFVVEHANLGAFRFELVEDSRSPAEILRGVPHAMTGPLVPTGDDDPLEPDDVLPVHYSLDSICTPELLVASLALDMAHYVAQCGEPPPGSESAFGAAVDVTAVWLGFGVFVANAALLPRAFERGGLVGFGVSRVGSLSQLELSYALALRIASIGADCSEIRPHLRTNPRSWVGDALRHFDERHHARVAALATSTLRGPYR
jgi:hypothetical protein